jgi:hypothetical protein
MSDLRHSDIWIGQYRLSGLHIVAGEFRRTASRAAQTPRGGKACFCALADEAALEFRQCPKLLKNQSPLRGRRVEGFGQAARPEASRRQVFNCLDRLLRRPRWQVELLDDHRVAPTSEFEDFMRSQVVCDRTRYFAR